MSEAQTEAVQGEEAEDEPLAVMGFCSVCDQSFLVHKGRGTSPCHGTDPAATFEFQDVVESVNLIVETMQPILNALRTDVLEFLAALGTDGLAKLRTLLETTDNEPAAAGNEASPSGPGGPELSLPSGPPKEEEGETGVARGLGEAPSSDDPGSSPPDSD